MNHGADFSHSDHCGRNAIKMAAKSGHDAVVRLLEEHSANQRILRPGINGGWFNVHKNAKYDIVLELLYFFNLSQCRWK